jgi:hypothetical protein
MPLWQILYHILFLSIVSLTLLGLRRWGKAGCALPLLVPFVLATISEWLLHLAWPEMLSADAQAGIGVAIAWMINVVIGIAAGALIFVVVPTKR